MDEHHTGRPPILSNDQMTEIFDDSNGDPSLMGYHQNLWDGKLLKTKNFL